MSFIPWLLNLFDFPSYGSNSRKKYTLRLLSKYSGRSTPHYWGKSPPSFDSFFDSLTYNLAKLLQNGAKLIQKLTTGFKNYKRNLDNFKQTIETPNSWSSMGYICPKNTFLQLKHYIQRTDLTILSTTVKIHRIPYVIFETISHFSRHNSSVFF